MTTPSVSILIATHDKPQALGACLRSLQIQKFDDFEAIVVHEQSPKMWESARVLNELKDNRFRFLSYPEDVNDFGITAKVWALEKSSGGIIAHVNGDCYYTPVYLERMVEPIASGRADFTYCDWVTHHNAYRVLEAFPRLGRIDSGGWLCRRDVVEATPWPSEQRKDCGDGWYVEQLAVGRRLEKVDGVLWVHN